MNGYSLIFTTAATKEEAKKIAKALLQQKLAACVQLSNIESFFIWEDSVNEEHEVLLLIKAKAGNFTEIESCIKSVHSYKVPEIVQIDIEEGSLQYLNWIDSVTK